MTFNMHENLNILINPEVLLSIGVLGLVLYGINLSTLKVSIGALFIVGILTKADPFFPIFPEFAYSYITNGLLTINS